MSWRSVGSDDVPLMLRALLELILAGMLGFLGMLPVVGVHLFGRHHHVVKVVGCIV